MTVATKSSKRRGHVVCYALDVDAYQLLRAMLPTGRGMGALMSELVRREAVARANRAAMLQALATDTAERASRA